MNLKHKLAVFMSLILIIGLNASMAFAKFSPQPKQPFGKTLPVEFEGHVIKRLPALGFGSGIVDVFQGVVYKVDKVIKGNIKDKEIAVFHIILGPPLCEKDEPILSKKIFKAGNKLRVKAEYTSQGEYICLENPKNVIVLEESK